MTRTLALLACLAAAACADKYDDTRRVNPLAWISQHTGATFHPSTTYPRGTLSRANWVNK